MPQKIQNTYDDFPLFCGWPPNKVFFLENMAWEQHFQRQYQQQYHQLQGQYNKQLLQPHQEDQDPKDDKKYVVITKEMDEGMVYDCAICKQKLCMVFNQDKEEWVFDDCKQYEGVVYHFPLCYEVGVEIKRKGSYCSHR